MTTLFYFVRLAIHNLRRGGQRVLVALLCIAFGITALVAMTMLANSIESSVVLTPSQLVGGDISMGRKNEDTLFPADIDQIKALQQSGEISRYTLIAYNTSIAFHTSGSGELHFASAGMGIEPAQYPLAGSLIIEEPAAAGLASLLRQVGDVVPTRDVAEEYQLKVGDRIVLSDLRIGEAVAGTVRGIAYDTPNHQGDKIYYSVETAQALANGKPVVNVVIVNTPQPKAVSEALDASGWAVDWAAGRMGGSTANLWVIGLRSAGILSLLVGGIGIANTMQVLLKRRQHEIAIWKTLGYREGHLRLIFSIEAGLLGLAGSLLGAGLGVLISSGLLSVLRRTSSLLYGWTFSPAPPLLGILVGMLTTVIFAYWAIILSSQSRPVALLRDEPARLQARSGCSSAGLGLLLAVPFTILTSLVMESLVGGIAVLVCIVIGIGTLAGFFSVALWLCTHLIPVRRFPLARMAFNNLQRRGFALVFAMVALFAGVLSMSLGLAVTQRPSREFSPRSVDFQSYNLTVLASSGQEDAVRQAIQEQNPEKVGMGYRAAFRSMRVVGQGTPVSAMDAVLVGRSDPEDYVVRGASWGSQPDGVYAYARSNLKAGSQVDVTFNDGTTHVFTVVGTYGINDRSLNLYPPTGLLMTAEGFTQAVRPDSLTYFVQVAPEQVSRTATALGSALPQATVVNLVAYAGRFMQSYQKLFVMPMAMAGLALLAGFLLVANSVSLAMLDRRYEIGVLKAIGYSQRLILSILAIEYGLVGGLATGAGVIFIQGLLAVLALASHLSASVLLLSFPALMLIAFCGVGLTLLVVFGVTWGPTRVSPLVVLNERNG